MQIRVVGDSFSRVFFFLTFFFFCSFVKFDFAFEAEGEREERRERERDSRFFAGTGGRFVFRKIFLYGVSILCCDATRFDSCGCLYVARVFF